MTWALAAAAAVLLAFAAVSRRLDGSMITPAIVFTGAGLVLGSDVVGLVDVEPHGHTVRLLAEATLGLVLFADASRIDIAALRREVGVPVRLLGIGLPLTIVAGALVALPLLGELAFLEAVVLAVVLAPTDAALGQAVVTEERLPSRIRQGLNVETGSTTASVCRCSSSRSRRPRSRPRMRAAAARFASSRSRSATA